MAGWGLPLGTVDPSPAWVVGRGAGVQREPTRQRPDPTRDERSVRRCPPSATVAGERAARAEASVARPRRRAERPKRAGTARAFVACRQVVVVTRHAVAIVVVVAWVRLAYLKFRLWVCGTARCGESDVASGGDERCASSVRNGGWRREVHI